MFKFLDAHIDQCNDNVRLQTQEPADLSLTPRSSFPKGGRSTAADHLSSQYSFAYMTCLLGHSANLREDGPEEDYFPGSTTKYIAQDCSTHISVIRRLYSLKRDDKQNLNATFFEFDSAAKVKSETELQRELARICDYERTCLKMSLDQLLAVAQEDTGAARGKRIHEIVKLFYNANEIYAEIIEKRDTST
ncbi:Ent-kaurene synthase [Mycena venus]|uniref:Ent-kaurene synthase n=1 Tax=Mycena venus TaxID=2733690 RepID=A0A8H7D7N7_9AGAR|nr:Ent-kaurene synthase [Mycena venus]